MLWALIALAIAGVVLFAESASAATSNTDSGNEDDTANVTSGGITGAQRDLALAIATAEGFFIAGSIPARANNPGDLVIPGWTGAKLGDEGISVFRSSDEGWNRLYSQIDLIASGRSHVYTMADSIGEMAAKWTRTDPQNWADNIVAYLNANGWQVGTSTTLDEILG